MLAPLTSSTASVNSLTQTSSSQNTTTSNSSLFKVTIVIAIIIVAVAISTTIIVMAGILIFFLRRKKKWKLEPTTNQTCHNTTDMLEISAKTSHDILSYSNTNNDPDTNEGDGYYAEVEKKTQNPQECIS